MCRIMFRSFNSYEMKIKANASGTNLDTFSHVCQTFLSVMFRWLQRPVSDEETPRPEPPEPLTFRPMMSKTSPSYITELRGYNTEEQNANVKKVGQNFKKKCCTHYTLLYPPLLPRHEMTKYQHHSCFSSSCSFIHDSKDDWGRTCGPAHIFSSKVREE